MKLRTKRCLVPMAALCLAAWAAAAQRPVPRPNLDSMGEAARQGIEAMQATVERLEREGAPAADRAEAFGHLGRELHAFRLLDAAEAAYETARELAPDDHRWAYYLALVRHTRGDLEAAVADYQAALAGGRDVLPTLLHLGRALLELDRIDEAERRFTRALELDPASAAALHGLGRVAAARGDDATAVERFERVLELAPDADSVHYQLAQSYRRLGDMERARQHLAQRGEGEVHFADPLGQELVRLATGTAYETVFSLARDPSVADEELLGFALGQLSDVLGAVEQLRTGLAAREPGAEERAAEARMHYVLGGLQARSGHDEEAMAAFRAALEMDPELHPARIELGDALARAGRFEEAGAEYSTVLARRPEDPAALLKRAAAAMARERHGEALADLERLVAIDPAHREGRVRLAASLAALGRMEESEAAYRAALSLDLAPRERLNVHLRLGDLLRARGDLEAADGEYRRALQVDPTAPAALAAVAGLAGQNGRYAEAAEIYGRLVALHPEDRRARLAEATALILGGRHAEARDRLEAGLTRAPDDVALLDLLARHLASSPDRAVREGARAVELAEELIEAVPTMESAETLAMAYAEAGRFSEAASVQERILERLEELGEEVPPATRARLERHLALYRRGEPCCGEDAGG